MSTLSTTKPAKAAVKNFSPAITVITPVATIIHDHSQTADTEGQFADGKFKVTALVSKDEDMTEVDTAADEAAAAEFGKAGPRPYRDGDMTGKPEQSGAWIINAKTAYAPKLWDAQGNAYTGHVGRGAIVRLHVQMVPHRAGGSPGIAPRLLAVQVIEPGQQSSAVNPFGKPVVAAAAPVAATVSSPEQIERTRKALAELKARVAR